MIGVFFVVRRSPTFLAPGIGFSEDRVGGMGASGSRAQASFTCSALLGALCSPPTVDRPGGSERDRRRSSGEFPTGWFLTGLGQVLVCGPGVADPCCIILYFTKGIY